MSTQNFPVILYDIDNNTIPINYTAKSNTFFIRSYQIFSIEIIENLITPNTIYSVKQNPTPLSNDDLFIINNNKSLNDNFGYTIYLESNIIIKVTGIDNISRFYYITYLPDNIINETQEHYNDLLINNHLPSFEELESALINENKAELLKRLLLDFKNIVNKKGTKISIIKFLNLIGFTPESIKVYDEYLIISNNQKTLTPNKEKDIKTGYYHVLYDNWLVDENEKYTIKNLPRRIININNLDEFFKRLEKAIALANIYFTLPEQDISFFGLANSVNIEKYLSIAGNTTILNESDFHHFRKHIFINLYNKENITNQTFLVKKNIQINNVTTNTEIKYYSSNNFPLQNNNDLFLVEQEIFDNNIPTNINQLDIKSLFGNLLHLKIISENTYCEYIIEEINNPLTKIVSDKFWLTTEHELNIVSKKLGNYKITINIYDIHNNRERYEYYYKIENNIAYIDFDIYNSKLLLNNNLQNSLNQDIDSTWYITEINDNGILPLNNTPTDLPNYFDNPLNFIKYLQNNTRYLLHEINKNFVVDNITETIPLKYIDNFLEIIAFKYNNDYTLKLRVTNPETLQKEYLDYNDENCYIINLDKLFITGINISNLEETLIEQYIYISTTEIGINLIPELFDLVLINNNDVTDILSIYDLPVEFDYRFTKIPTNYYFPLFFRDDSFILNWPLQIPGTPQIVDSIFPKLNNIFSGDNYYLKYGDIIVCKINENYIVESSDILWTIKNSFTNEIIFQTNDYSLKYRIKENTIYSIILNLKINGIEYTINKSSVQSSFI